MRATGKTFRRLLQAIQLASDGGKVLYVSSIIPSMRYNRDAALKIIYSYVAPEDYKFSLVNNSITFNNGGTIWFVSASVRPDYIIGMDRRKWKAIIDVHKFEEDEYKVIRCLSATGINII